MTPKRLAAALTFTLALSAGCTGSDIDQDTLNAREDGVLGRLFDTVKDYFVERAAEPAPIAPIKPWTGPGLGDDPAIDEMFDAMGLVQVETSSDDVNIDGALVGVFEHFPDANDPNDFYEEVCFFGASADQMPSQEALFYSEMYGFRASNGKVSDIQGKPIDKECVWCDEGNSGGDETRVIYYVNGIRSTPDKHCGQLEAIANLTGAVTIGVYNESDGGIKDVWQTAQDRFTITMENALAKFGIDQTVKIHENKAATMLTNLIVQRVRAKKRVEVWAHSQGGAVTSLALHRAIRALEAEGSWPVMRDGQLDYAAINVVTFGSAAPKWPFGGFPKGPTYTHYVHVRDATPSAVGLGAWGDYTTAGAKNAGDDAKMLFFDGEPADPETFDPADPADYFTEIPIDNASIEFLELKPKKYHAVQGCYLSMYEQLNGSWSKN